MLFLLLFIHLTLGAKILVFSPKFGFSHMNFMGSIADTLKGAGHDVTILQPEVNPAVRGTGSQMTKVITIEADEKVKEAIAPFGNKDLWTIIFGTSIYNPIGIVAPAPLMANAFVVSLKNILNQKKLLADLKAEKYDLMITELFDYGGFVLKYELEIPTIVGVHSSILFDTTADAMGIPVTPSFVPDSHGITGDDGSFFTRVLRLFCGSFTSYLENKLLDDIQKFSDEHYFEKGPNIKEMIGDLPILFTNAEPLLDFPRPSTSKIIDIGGLSLKPGKPLDENWLKLLSKRPKNVLISFGSVAPSSSMFPEVRSNIAKVVSTFPNVTFIWKYESPSDGTGRGVENLELSTWTPQTDLLASGKIDLFITHGGAGSIMESASTGVPLVVIPLFGDQMRNAKMIERFGTGIIYNKLKLDNEWGLTAAIKEGLSNPKLKEKANLARRMLKARPFSPQEQLIKYTALAAEFGYQLQLSPSGRKLNYFQYWNFDILMVSISLILLFLYVLIRFVRKILAKLGKSKSE